MNFVMDSFFRDQAARFGKQPEAVELETAVEAVPAAKPADDAGALMCEEELLGAFATQS